MYVCMYVYIGYICLCICIFMRASARQTQQRWCGRFPKFHRVFVWPRPWHIEIRHRVKRISTINLFGFETLKLKIRRLKLWRPGVWHMIRNCFCYHFIETTDSTSTTNNYWNIKQQLAKVLPPHARLRTARQTQAVHKHMYNNFNGFNENDKSLHMANFQLGSFLIGLVSNWGRF